MAEMVAKNRHVGRHSIGFRTAQRLREDYEKGIPLVELAKVYEMNMRTVWRIIKNEIYKAA